MDFVRRWSEKTDISAGRFIKWLDITASKFYDWRERYGKVNEHNVGIPTKEITYSDPKSIKIGVREAGLLHIDRLIDMSQRQ